MHVDKAVYLFARTARTKCHILGGLKVYFLTILGAGNLRSRSWWVDFFRGPSPWLVDDQLPLCPRMGIY